MSVTMTAKETAGLFDAGNYAKVAERGPDDDWRTFAAWGLVGDTERALAGLGAFDCPEARFYGAVARWMDGDEDAAARELEGLSDPHAQNLLALIRKPRITILAQLPTNDAGPHVLLTGGRKDPKFRIRNISFHPGFHVGDLRNRAYADVHSFYGPEDVPDLYLCEMVEWHQIPPNLQELPCPLIGATADFDLHVQAVYPWLKLFDVLMVTDDTEYRDLRRIVDRPAVTYPKVFGLSSRLPEFRERERDIDVWMSGTVFHPYHPDKIALLGQLYRADGIDPVFINGFIAEDAYYELLARSKTCLSYYRRAGGLVTRGLETLAMGAVALVQEGSVLGLYAGEDEGVVTYGPRDGCVVEAVRRVLADPQAYAIRARRGAELVRRTFAAQRVASQFMRFVTFLAARPRGNRPAPNGHDLNQKRSVLGKGWVPGDGEVIKEMFLGNIAHWQSLDQSNGTAALNDMGRELALHRMLLSSDGDGVMPAEEMEQAALKCFSMCAEREPDRIVPQFNMVRAVMHTFAPTSPEFAAARRLAETLVGTPARRWRVEPLDDVLPYDLWSYFFNYRAYTDLAVRMLSGRPGLERKLVALIHASLHFYLGHATDEVEHFRKAVELDREFPFYRLEYAARLVAGSPQDKAKATKLLAGLVRRSIVAVEAFYMLKRLRDRDGVEVADFDDLARIAARIEHQTLNTEPLGIDTSDAVAARRRAAGDVELSIVVVGRNDGGPAALLESLARQTAPRERYEIVYVDCFDRSPRPAVDCCDLTLATKRATNYYHEHAALNAGLVAASGPLVAVCDGSGPVAETFVDTVVGWFETNGGAASAEMFGIVDLEGGNGGGAPMRWYVFRRDSAIGIGGFDEFVSYMYGRGRPAELASRLLNAGFEGWRFVNGRRIPIRRGDGTVPDLETCMTGPPANATPGQSIMSSVLAVLCEGPTDQDRIAPLRMNADVHKLLLARDRQEAGSDPA